MTTNRYVPYVAIAGYVSYFGCGLIGSGFPNQSFGQILSWQVGTTFAVTANVVAGVWLAKAGQDLASAGFTLLGIVECVFFSSIVLTEVDYRIMATGILLMVPSMILIAFCTTFPVWVRVAGLATSVLFIVEYFTVVRGLHRPVDAMQKASFITEEALGVVWSFYFWKEARRQERQ